MAGTAAVASWTYLPEVRTKYAGFDLLSSAGLDA